MPHQILPKLALALVALGAAAGVLAGCTGNSGDAKVDTKTEPTRVDFNAANFVDPTGLDEVGIWGQYLGTSSSFSYPSVTASVADAPGPYYSSSSSPGGRPVGSGINPIDRQVNRIGLSTSVGSIPARTSQSMGLLSIAALAARSMLHHRTPARPPRQP